MTLDRYSRIAKVLQQRQPDLTVVADHVHKGKNLSSIVLTCDAVGVMTLHSATNDPTFRAHKGTTVGAHKWVDTRVYGDISEPLLELKNNNFQIVACRYYRRCFRLSADRLHQPTALLLGAEIDGISSKQNPILTIQSLYQC